MSGKPGRPTKYKPEYDEQVYKLCLLGATDEQIADFFEVSVQTIHNWAAEHEGFLESRKKGKAIADANVAEALYHRALGYEHDAVKIMSYEGGSWEHEYRKRYPPDTAAAFIWLKNRAGWRDKQEVQHEGAVEVRTVRLPATESDPNEWAERFRGATSGAIGHSGDGPGK